MNVRTLILISTFSFSFAVGKAPAGSDFPTLKQTTAKYRNAKLVQMSVEKSVQSELTGKENFYKGTIYLSAGRFRLVNSEPDKSVIVFDGKTVWNEQPPSPDFPGPVQVTKTKLAGKDKSQTLFATLLTRDPVTKNFKIISEKKEGEQMIYQAAPLTSELTVKELTVKINSKKNLVSEISYKDDLGNRTIMKFSNPQFKKAIDKTLFDYKPPKGAQVTEI